MRAELIAIGTELLRFGRRDTNTEWMTGRLIERGVEVAGRMQVVDDPVRIAAVIEQAAGRCDLVVLCGGLGPTDDDRTREALAKATGFALQRDRALVARLRRLFEERGRRFDPIQERQADRPEGARWIVNPMGTAQGIDLRLGPCRVLALPGVPAELKAMFDRHLDDWVVGAARRAVVHRTLHVGGRGEGSVDAQLQDLYETPGVDVTILAGHEGIEIHLFADAADRTDAALRVERLEARMVERLGADLYARDGEPLASVVGRRLIARSETLSVAESCTGGLIGGALTAVAGSSGWFLGGLIVYSNELKRSLATVPPSLIERDGAVSESVACALAEGARSATRADWGLGITGVAGPGGGTSEKPVGTVHLGVAGPGGASHATVRQIGDRELIRRRTVVWALDRLRRRLEGDERERR